MKSAPTKTEILLRLAQKGSIRAKDLDEHGIPRTYLRRLCERGMLERVDRGVYRLPDAPVTESHSLSLVAVRVPHATICLLSALQVHELTTELPHAVWIMIARHARYPNISYPTIEVVRASGSALTHGVESREIEGVPIKITTAAKTVADCFRYRSHVGLDTALEALREYFRMGLNKNELALAARTDRVFTFMKPYMEALA